MRCLCFLLAACFAQVSFAQMYVRTKKNIGFYTGVTYKNAQMNTLSVGITKSLWRYIEPEIGLRASLPISASADNNQMDNVYITSSLNFRKSLMAINQRKKGRSCRGEVLEIFVAPEYHVLIKSQTNRYDVGQFSLRGGFGIFHYQTGNSKRIKSWNVKGQLYYRYVPGPVTSSMSIKNEFGIQLRIFKFKTYDFVE